MLDTEHFRVTFGDKCIEIYAKSKDKWDNTYYKLVKSYTKGNATTELLSEILEKLNPTIKRPEIPPGAIPEGSFKGEKKEYKFKQEIWD